jgi:hypothetical protein
MNNYLQTLREKLIEKGWVTNFNASTLARLVHEHYSELLAKQSDGFHTMSEHYDHRHSLCLALMHSMPEHWWFSRRHYEGELCFGDGRWFVVGCLLPNTKVEQREISYHLPIRLWEAAQATGARELERGLPWDGHTPEDVVNRLREWATGT